MTTMIGDPTNYLSLALDARKAANALRLFCKTGKKSKDLNDSLRDAVDSLKALQAGGALFSQLHSSSSYEYYEQIRTLQEVQDSMREAELVEKLNSILSGSPAEGKKVAGIAVRFFAQLENRAMQRFNQASSMTM